MFYLLQDRNTKIMQECVLKKAKETAHSFFELLWLFLSISLYLQLMICMAQSNAIYHPGPEEKNKNPSREVSSSAGEKNNKQIHENVAKERCDSWRDRKVIFIIRQPKLW